MLLTIPTPPSVNAMYANRKRGGRIKTPKYRAWIERAGWEIITQKPERIKGRYRVSITLPRIRGDGDNRIKAILDLLVSLCITPDDRHCQRVECEVDRDRTGYAIVHIEAVGDAPQAKERAA